MVVPIPNEVTLGDEGPFPLFRRFLYAAARMILNAVAFMVAAKRTKGEGLFTKLSTLIVL
jgi:hypothetical protein